MGMHSDNNGSKRIRRAVPKAIACVLILLGYFSIMQGVALSQPSHPTQISEDGLNLIASFECFSGTAYKNKGETYYTIGYGHYGADVSAGQTITQAQARELLRSDVVRYANAVNVFLDQNDISLGQNQFDALVSYTYNRGAYVWSNKEAPLETLLKDGYQNHTAEEITNAFVESWGSNKNYETGLKNRRRKEAAYFLVNLPVPDDDLTVNPSYPTPMTCYPLAKSGKIAVYNASGVAYSTDSRYIAPRDQCRILAVYTNGLCKVTYPSSTSSTGYRTEYAHFSDFSSTNVNPYPWSPAGTVKSFTKQDMGTAYGEIWATDNCVVIAAEGSKIQVVYPLDGGGYKCGWVSTEDDSGSSIPEQIDVPGPVAAGAFDGKTVVVMAPERVEFSSAEYISAGDVCRITDINPLTGYCKVTYPSGSDDVFTATRTKEKTIAITSFVEYQPTFAMQRVTTDEKYVVYPTSSMQTYGRTWYLDPGDEFYTVARAANGATEVLYYCNRGAHAGYWKLGWVDLPYYWLDLNGWLDGASAGDLGSYGAADVYVNGNKLAERARDFYSNNGTFPRGSSYEVGNIVASEGRVYNGVHSGSASGRLMGNTSVSLDFATDHAFCSLIRIQHRPNKTEYLEGEGLDVTGLVVESVATDGVGTDVTGECGIAGYDSTPGVKTVTVSYKDKTTAFTVTVNMKSAVGLAIASVPTKTEYALGDELDLAGLEVRATYNNGTSSVVDDCSVNVERDITETSGRKTVSVSYVYNGAEVSTSFEVIVVGGTTCPAGDINGDGGVDNKDLTRLFQYLSDWDVEVVEGNLDTNGDGGVDNKDLTRLFQYLSDWDVEVHGGTN